MASPFVKFPGGKRAHVSLVIPYLPPTFRSYIEPFVGGGGMFFGLEAAGMLCGVDIILSDYDADLIQLYEAVRDDPVQLRAGALEEAVFIAGYETRPQRKEAYNELRQLYNLGDRLPHYQLYLRAACYNGVFRMSKAGNMNMPPRDHLDRLPDSLVSAEALSACAAALKPVDLLDWHFSQIESDGSVFVGPGTVVYLDPPYDGAGGFREYTAEGFSTHDQIEVLQLAAEWTDRGARVIYSNAYTPWTRRAVKKYWPAATVTLIDATRVVSCKASTRGVVKEILAHA